LLREGRARELTASSEPPRLAFAAASAAARSRSCARRFGPMRKATGVSGF
jgi:hypothetical protein